MPLALRLHGNFVFLSNAVTKVQANHKVLNIIGTHQLLTADNVDLPDQHKQYVL